MPRTGTRPLANKTNYIDQPLIPPNQKWNASEGNYMVDKINASGLNDILPVAKKFDDTYYPPPQTISANQEWTINTTNAGNGNGFAEIITASGTPVLTFTGFTIRKRLISTETGQTVTLEDGHEYTILSLKRGALYDLYVTDNGAASTTPTLTTPTLTLVPQDGAIGYTISDEDPAATDGVLTYDTNSDFSTEIPVPGYAFATKTGTISSLVNGTPYYARIINSASGYNNSGYGSDAATPSASIVQLIAPTANTPTVDSSTAITVTCNDPNTSPQETSMLFRCYSDVGKTTLVDSSSEVAGTTSYQFTGLTASTQYWFDVIAEGDNVTTSDSDPSNTVTETTSTPSSFTITGFTDTGLNIYVDVNLSAGGYGANDGTSPMNSADFATYDFATNGGNATAITGINARKPDGFDLGSASLLTGGESIVRLFITFDTQPNGLETFQFGPTNSTSIYNVGGTAMADTERTGTITASSGGSDTILGVTGGVLYLNPTDATKYSLTGSDINTETSETSDLNVVTYPAVAGGKPQLIASEVVLGSVDNIDRSGILTNTVSLGAAFTLVFQMNGLIDTTGTNVVINEGTVGSSPNDYVRINGSASLEYIGWDGAAVKRCTFDISGLTLSNDILFIIGKDINGNTICRADGVALTPLLNDLTIGTNAFNVNYIHGISNSYLTGARGKIIIYNKLISTPEAVTIEANI